MKKQPIDNITWIPIEELHTNDYNPNHVFKQELQLIHTSITRNGWLQPIIINHDKTIIDGYHRVTLLKQDPELYQQTQGKVPCITLNLTKPQRILLTIRINRAKGTHTAYKMHQAITTLHHEYGLNKETIAHEIGATTEEITLLLTENIFTQKHYNETTKYNQAWTPQK